MSNVLQYIRWMIRLGFASEPIGSDLCCLGLQSFKIRVLVGTVKVD